MLKKLLLLYFTLFISVVTNAQYTEVGQGAFTRNNIGPIVSDSGSSAYYSRMAYIYPAMTIAGLNHGDSITALSFKSSNFDTLRAPTRMKIYIKATSKADFGAGSLNWLAESRNGMELVYDNDPSPVIGDKPKYVPFIFDNNKKFFWDTTGGKVNFQILIEYTQRTNQVEPIRWYVENNASVNGFVSVNEGKFLYGPDTSGMDSMTSVQSILKPTLRIHHPINNDDLEVQDIYALGTIPILMRQADSIKLAFYNAGSSEVTNRKVYINVSGANTFYDSITISKAQPYTRQFAYFDSYTPTNQGIDSIELTLGSDDNDSNNVITKNVVVNYNVYSHVDPFQGNSGGIGFNGQTGDFVAKFYVKGESFINQISVDFSSNNLPFQLGIWDDNGANGGPGTELFMSDTSLSSTGTYIMSVLPRVKVEDGYYVGIRQASNINVGFSFQYERPVRPSTFFFTAPAGFTDWTPFSPGFDFNFNIRPRLQVANDLGVYAIASPQENDSILYSLTDSLQLSATFINYGYKNQGVALANFVVTNRFGQTVFSNNKLLSLNAGDSITVDFGKLSLFNLGEFTATASVNISTDSVIDNNSQSIDFYLIKKNDVAVDRFFSPAANDTFDLNREYFFPVLRVANYGSNDQTNFPVFCEIVNANGDVLQKVNKTISIDANTSQIIDLDSLNLTEEGNLLLRAYTLLDRDSFPQNDTLTIPLVSVKMEDMLITEIYKPINQGKYEKGTSITPFVNFRNDGRTNYDSVYFYASLFGEDGSVLYRDTNISSSSFFSTGQFQLNAFNADSLGDFRFYVEAYVPGDQQEDNDTLSSYFSVVTANDLKIERLVGPISVNVASNDTKEVEFLVENRGLRDAKGANFSLEIIDNQNNVVLNENKNFDISSFSTDTLRFSAISLSLVGDYYVSLTNNWKEEDEPNKYDTLNTTFIIRNQNDLAIQSHQKPRNLDTVEWGQIISPEVLLSNSGLSSSEGTRLELKVKNPGGDIVLQDTLVVGLIASNRLSLLNTTKSIVANAKGIYTIESRLIDYIDDNIANNSFSSSFEVVVRRDILVSRALNPLSLQNLPINKRHRPRVELFNNGLEDIQNVASFCRVYVDGSQMYNDSRLLDIASGQSVIVLFDSTLQSEDITEARLEFICGALDDQVSTNDTLNILFNFSKELTVSSIESNSSKVYPNPFNTAINIISSTPIQSVKIYDIKGGLVFSSEYENSLKEYIMLDIVPGTYSVEVLSDNQIEYHTVIKSN